MGAINRLLKEGETGLVDQILRASTPERVDVETAICLLTVTLPAKSKLRYRTQLYEQTLARTGKETLRGLE